MIRRAVVGAATAAVLAGCSSDAGAPAASGPVTEGPVTEGPAVSEPAVSSSNGASGAQCVVRLHGKGGDGAPTTEDGGVTILSPAGNGEGWGGREWRYFPDDEYAAARDIVAAAVEPCAEVIVGGFSNGAAFAAKLYCRGETLDGRLVGVVVDDPVPDAGTAGCAPAPDVAVTLYWTGALADTAQPGWDCAEGDWTCEGGTTIGIDAYAAALGTGVRDSPFDEHQPYLDAPELQF